MSKIKLTIDGKEIEVEKGQTVLEAARAGGIYIPTICAHEDLPNYGACRMCIVEIDKVRGFPTSCTTPAEEGMVVRTRSEEIDTLRRRILELMLSGHPNSCLVCPHREDCEKYRPRASKAGRTTRCGFCNNRDTCEIRDLSARILEKDLDLETIYVNHLVENQDPFMDRDYNLCILCGRCFRICEKIHGVPAIALTSRGRWAKIGTSFNKSHVDSGCTFCGACVDICPTGTLSDRYAKWYGAPDREVLSACHVCPEGCSFWSLASGSKMVASRMIAFNREARLCAIGRFAYAQLVNTPDRLRRPMMMESGEQITADWDEAIARLAADLQSRKGPRLVILANEAETREVRYLYEKLAHDLGAAFGAVPAGQSAASIKPAHVHQDLQSGKFTAALVAGDFLEPEPLSKLEYVAAIDFLPSPAAARAMVLLPAAVLSEVSGTFRNSAGEVKAVVATSAAPGQARPEWDILTALGRALGLPGYEDKAVSEVTPDIGKDRAPDPFAGSPRDKLSDIPVRFRGHYIGDHVCALEEMGFPAGAPRPGSEPEVPAEGFEVVEKTEIIPNFHLLKIKAPQVAKFAKPGQFVIVMVKETSERVPFTLSDWDAEDGTITLIVEEVGRSSREVALLKTGGKIAHVSGPLGTPFEVKNYGTVALGGGCYGIGSIYPLARSLKAAGNKVIVVVEAASSHLLYWEDKLRAVADEYLVATKDGSTGTRGGVQEIFEDLAGGVDLFVAIGCTFMMRMVAEKLEGKGAALQVALNPIMVDGTGMCGACRVSVAGETKFACVDGPMFDGLAVDWDELFSRRGAYAVTEIEALPQGAARERAHEKLAGHDRGGCSGNCKR